MTITYEHQLKMRRLFIGDEILPSYMGFFHNQPCTSWNVNKKHVFLKFWSLLLVFVPICSDKPQQKMAASCVDIVPCPWCTTRVWLMIFPGSQHHGLWRHIWGLKVLGGSSQEPTKWLGLILTTGSNWDDPPSGCRFFLQLTFGGQETRKWGVWDTYIICIFMKVWYTYNMYIYIWNHVIDS